MLIARPADRGADASLVLDLEREVILSAEEAVMRTTTLHGSKVLPPHSALF